MAEIDVRARASAIRSANALVEFFSFFFILFGGLESLDQMASVPGLPPATQELLDLLGGVFRQIWGWSALLVGASPTCEGYLWRFWIWSQVAGSRSKSLQETPMSRRFLKLALLDLSPIRSL